MAKSMCNLHGIPYVMCCPVCNQRDSYLVRGNVDAFDQGYEDGFNNRPSRIDRWGSHADKGDYEYGLKTGKANASKGTLRHVRKAGALV